MILPIQENQNLKRHCNQETKNTNWLELKRKPRPLYSLLIPSEEKL